MPRVALGLGPECLRNIEKCQLFALVRARDKLAVKLQTMTEVCEIENFLLADCTEGELTETITDKIASGLSNITRTLPFKGCPSKKVGMCLEYVVSLTIVKAADSFPFLFSS